jgi:hypothetical protein
MGFGEGAIEGVVVMSGEIKIREVFMFCRVE